MTINSIFSALKLSKSVISIFVLLRTAGSYSMNSGGPALVALNSTTPSSDFAGVSILQAEKFSFRLMNKPDYLESSQWLWKWRLDLYV